MGNYKTRDCCKDEHQLQGVFGTESKNNRCEMYSSFRVRGQNSKLSYRHSELGEVKVNNNNQKLGMFSPAHSSLYILCPQEREREKPIPLFFPFPFSLQQYQME